MSAYLDERYLTWLYSQIGSVKLRNRKKSYWSLARKMYKTEFVWLIPNDDNRVEDGRDLRFQFLEECEIDQADRGWLDLGCSMLEMLIALSRRLAFETEGDARVWFWHLVEQLELGQFSDAYFDDNAEEQVDEALARVIWRTYSPTGKGGLFPLRYPDQDQREVEIWYQMSSYLLELLD